MIVVEWVSFGMFAALASLSAAFYLRGISPTKRKLDYLKRVGNPFADISHLEPMVQDDINYMRQTARLAVAFLVVVNVVFLALGKYSI